MVIWCEQQQIMRQQYGHLMWTTADNATTCLRTHYIKFLQPITVCPRYNAPRYNADSGITRSLAQSCVSTAQYAHIAVYYKQTDYKQEHNKHYQYTVGAVLLACCSICTVWILHLLSAPFWIDVTHSIGSFTNAVPVLITINYANLVHVC